MKSRAAAGPFFPVVLGKGKRLFEEGDARSALQLAETKRFAAGIVILEYTPPKA